MFMVLLLLMVCRILIKKGELNLLLKIDLFYFILFIIFTLSIYITSGLQYYFIRDQYGIKFEKKDLLLLPVAMNLWSFIIPMQGGVIFFTIFLKNKHKVKVADSLSITIFLYLVILSFTGFLGLVFAVIYGKLFSIFSLISLLLLLNPFFIFITYKIMFIIPDFKIKLVIHIFNFVKEITGNMNKMWVDHKNVGSILLLSILQMIITAFWYLSIAQALGYHNITFLALLLLALWMNVSLVIRFTPNNLGVTQIVSAILFSLISLSPEQGIMISLIATLSSTVVALTLGAGATFYYLRCWHIRSLKEVSG